MSRQQAGLAARFAFGVAALALLAAAPAPDAAVRNGRIRVLLPSRPAGGYFDLDNHGASTLTLIGANSPGCGSLMLHRSLASGGTDRMESVDRVSVPAHGSLQFAPGGYHLMCMEPTSGLRPGGTIPVTLTFSGGGTLTGDFAVEGSHGR